MKIKKDSKGRNLLLGEDQQTTGRYRYRYTDNYGTQGVLYSWKLVPTDKMPAGKRPDLSLREKEKQLQEKIAQNVNTHNGNMTVATLIDEYLKTKNNVRASTFKMMQYKQNGILKYSKFANLKIGNVKPIDINSFYRYLLNENHAKYSTIKGYHILIHGAFDFAVANDFILKNPSKAALSNFNNDVEEVVPLTQDQQKELENFLRTSKYPHKGMRSFIMLLLHSGMRCGECCGLRWKDVDFDNKTIKVEGQIAKQSEGLVYCPTKNGMKRIIPMDNIAYETLLDLKNESGHSEFVFVHSNDKAYEPQSVCRYIGVYLNQRLQKNGYSIPYLHPHLMRHTYCTRLAEKGMDIKVLQTIMGHRSLDITMKVYNHANQNRVVEEFCRVMSDF